MGLFMVLLALYSTVRTRRLVASRAPADRDAFIAGFEGRVDPSVLVEVFLYFQETMGAELDFPVLASDDIASIYGIVDGDLEDTVEELLDRLDRYLRPPPYSPIETIADLAHFLESCPRNNLVPQEPGSTPSTR